MGLEENHHYWKQSQAGIAVGADGIFMETHIDPKKSKSDSET